MSSDEYMIKVSGVLAEYTTTFSFGEKALDSASRWAMNWYRSGFDADSVIAGLREGMTGKITKKEQVGHHYAHLTEIIKNYRSTSLKNNTPRTGCHLCADGYVEVPHPTCVENMGWNQHAHENSYYTCVVFCKCPLGQFKASTESSYEKDGRQLKMWQLPGYEDFVALNWSELMEQRQELLAQRHIKQAEELKKNAKVISEVRRGPLPEASSFPVTVTQVVSKAVPQQASNQAKRQQIAAKPTTTPAVPPTSQESGNGFF